MLVLDTSYCCVVPSCCSRDKSFSSLAVLCVYRRLVDCLRQISAVTRLCFAGGVVCAFLSVGGSLFMFLTPPPGSIAVVLRRVVSYLHCWAVQNTRTATTAAAGMDGGGRRLEADGLDLCLMAGDPAYGNGGGGELVRALEELPQRMADVEELAITEGLHKEVKTNVLFLFCVQSILKSERSMM